MYPTSIEDYLIISRNTLTNSMSPKFKVTPMDAGPRQEKSEGVPEKMRHLLRGWEGRSWSGIP